MGWLSLLKNNTKKRSLLAFVVIFIAAPHLCSGIDTLEGLTKIKVVADQANIRLKPDITSIIIKQVPQGTILKSPRKDSEWYLIRFETDEGELALGYVHESLVIILERPPERKPKKEEKKDTRKAQKEQATKEKKKPIREKKRKEKVLPPPKIKPIPSLRPSRPHFILSLHGGGSVISGGDLNEGAEGLADYYSDSLAIDGDGEIKPARLGYMLGGDLLFPLSSHLFLGIGIDYLLVERQSRVEFQKGSWTETLTTRPKIKALPLRLFLTSYLLPSFYAKMGVEYYFAQCFYSYRFERENFREEWQGEAKARDFGFIGGLGIDMEFSPAFSSFIEVTGRYAKIKGFKGKDRHIDSTGLDVTEEGKLYFYLGQISGGNSYPLLFIREKKPTAFVSDLREATITLSGLSAKIGIKIRF